MLSNSFILIDRKKYWVIVVHGGIMLKLHNIVKAYDTTIAVNDVSFNISSGEVFGIIGPNGAGKTTLIECIEGIKKPDSGEIKLFDTDDRSEIKERIGVQLQTTGFFKQLTVIELLRFYASFYKKKKDPYEMLRTLRLEEKEKALVKSLSGGMYQRLSLAVALINDPDFLFLDEPTTGLDPASRRIIWDIVKDYADQNKAVFITTHYMEEASYLCDRVGIMDRGKMIALDTPEKLVKEHIGEKTIEVDFETEIKEDVVKQIDAVMEHWIKNNKLILSTNNTNDTLTSIFKLPYKTQDMKVRQGNLEDVFLKLTNRGLEE